MVFERTWFPSESRMHIPNPTLLMVFENEASTLHLYLSLVGFLHLKFTSPLCWEALGVIEILFWLVRFCLRLALLHPSKRCLALSKTVTLESDTCCHNLRFLAFQMLHIKSDDDLNLSWRHLLQQIKDYIWSIIKLVQWWRDQMPNISCKPYINGCLTMKTNMVDILMGVFTHDTSWWAIDTPASQLYPRWKTVSTDSPHQIFDFRKHFQSPDTTPIPRFSQVIIIYNLFNANNY